MGNRLACLRAIIEKLAFYFGISSDDDEDDDGDEDDSNDGDDDDDNDDNAQFIRCPPAGAHMATMRLPGPSPWGPEG